MFFLSLALFAQSATLDTDTGKAAGQCNRALAADMGTARLATLRGFAQVTYLGMSVAKAEGVKDNFSKRTFEMLFDARDAAAKAPKPTPALLAECDSRFPLARSTAPVELPRDALDRDLTCVGALSFLVAGAESWGREKTAVRAEYQPYFDGLTARISKNPRTNAALGEQESFAGAVNNALRISLDTGNLETVLLSCSKLPT